MDEIKFKITLKGNGSFYIREGWLTKGLVEIEKNPELFSKKYCILSCCLIQCLLLWVKITQP